MAYDRHNTDASCLSQKIVKWVIFSHYTVSNVEISFVNQNKQTYVLYK